MLGTVSAFAYRHRETKKNLCRGGRSQDLPDTDLEPAVRQLKYVTHIVCFAVLHTNLSAFLTFLAVPNNTNSVSLNTTVKNFNQPCGQAYVQYST